jgi:hypothetical protein
MTIFVVLPPALIALIYAVSGNIDRAFGVWQGFPLNVSSWSLGLGYVTTFTTFRAYFAPRFSQASRYTTLAVAVILASGLLALGWTMVAGDWEVRPFVYRLTLAAVVAAGAAVIGELLYRIGGVGQYVIGSRWLGRLLVGRNEYDAFVEREAERLKQDYDDYVKSIRKRD